MPPWNDISVCVFDAYGTLFDFDAVVAVAGAALGERQAELSGTWRRKQLEYTWLRSLMGRHADFWQVTGEALDFALASLGRPDPVLRARLMECYLAIPTFPEVHDMLSRLAAKRMKTAILSNGSPMMLTAACNSAALTSRFDAVLSVESVGIFKPHPSVYKLVTDHFEVTPQQVAFVSSNGWDAAAGAAFGFRVLWVNRRGAQREMLPVGPEAEGRDLLALPDLLGL